MKRGKREEMNSDNRLTYNSILEEICIIKFSCSLFLSKMLSRQANIREDFSVESTLSLSSSVPHNEQHKSDWNSLLCSSLLIASSASYILVCWFYSRIFYVIMWKWRKEKKKEEEDTQQSKQSAAAEIKWNESNGINEVK